MSRVAMPRAPPCGLLGAVQGELQNVPGTTFACICAPDGLQRRRKALRLLLPSFTLPIVLFQPPPTTPPPLLLLLLLFYCHFSLLLLILLATTSATTTTTPTTTTTTTTTTTISITTTYYCYHDDDDYYYDHNDDDDHYPAAAAVRGRPHRRAPVHPDNAWVFGRGYIAGKASAIISNA